MFRLEVLVRNERPKEALKVDDIDIADDYLNGFIVVSTEPRHKSTMHVPIDNSQSFTFGQAIQPGQSNRFIFNLRAVKTGLFRGDVDVTQGMQFVTEMAQTLVKEEAR